MVGHPMVRPASEVKLFNFTDLIVASLCKDGKRNFEKDENKVIKRNY